MPDGSRYAVDVMEIALNRATHYAHEFGGDIQKSLKEDTIPLFEEDDYDIVDWAVNNMNFSELKTARICERPDDEEVDFEEGWVNGKKEFSENIPPLEWAEENLLKAKCVTSEIADTGDYDSIWHVEDCDGRKSFGHTLTEAIQDAMKDDDDPTRYDYVPLEFR